MKTLKDLKDENNPDIVSINILKEEMNKYIRKIEKILQNEPLINLTGDLILEDIPNKELDSIKKFIKFFFNLDKINYKI